MENDCVVGFIKDMKRCAYDFVGKVTSDVYRKFITWCEVTGIEIRIPTVLYEETRKIFCFQGTHVL